MELNVLDTVVLRKNITSHGLKKGDLGVIVEKYKPNGIEVEFVMGTGKTRALLTLKADEVRLLSDSDVLSVRDESAA